MRGKKTVARDMHTVCPPGHDGGEEIKEEDVTSLVTAQVRQRHRLLREGVCMIGFNGHHDREKRKKYLPHIDAIAFIV